MAAAVAPRHIGEIVRNDVIGTAGRVASDAEGVNKTCQFAKKVIEAVGYLFGALSTGAKNLATTLSHFSSIAEIFEVLKRLNQVVVGCAKSHWAELVALSATLASRAIGVVNFIDKVAGGIPALADFVSTVGSTYVLAPLGLVANGFAMANDSIKIHEGYAQIEAAEAALAFSQVKKMCHDTVGAGLPQAKQDAYTLAYNRLNAAAGNLALNDPKYQEIKQLLGIPLDQNRNNIQPIVQAHDDVAGRVGQLWTAFSNALNAHVAPGAHGPDAEIAGLINHKITHDVARWSKDVDIVHINKIKSILGIVAAITKIAIITLGAVGLFVTVAALASTAPLMIAVGLAVTGMALTKVIYDKLYDDKTELMRPLAANAAQLTCTERTADAMKNKILAVKAYA